MADSAMQYTAPAPKINGLVGRLASLSASAVVTDSALERISLEAEDLMRTDPAGANTVLGGVAALRGDIENCRRHYETALRIDRDLTHQFNYSVSLSHLEENAESLEVACDALRVYPDSPELIEHAITAAVDSGSFTRARNLSNRWDALLRSKPEITSHAMRRITSHERRKRLPPGKPSRPLMWRPREANRLAACARQLAAAVDSQLFSEQGVGRVLRTLSCVQRAANFRTSNAFISSDDAGGSFLYDRFVHATPDEASDLNERLADRIAANPDLMTDPGLRFVVVFTGKGSSDGRNP